MIEFLSKNYWALLVMCELIFFLFCIFLYIRNQHVYKTRDKMIFDVNNHNQTAREYGYRIIDTSKVMKTVSYSKMMLKFWIWPAWKMFDFHIHVIEKPRPREYNVSWFLPIDNEHCNFTFKAPPGMPGCNDLKVFRILVPDPQIVSFWKCSSIWYRIKFLFKGEISLTIWGAGMPPVSIGIGETVVKQERGKDEQSR